MSKLKTFLEPIVDVNLLSMLLGLKSQHFAACSRTIESHVRQFTMTDGRGKPRDLYAPDKSLGWIQNKILRRILYLHPVPDLISCMDSYPNAGA
jgi:hypothetical protein